MARRQQAEDSFNNLQNSIKSIYAELKKYDVESLTEAETELSRLQGEYRILQELIAKAPDDEPKKKVSPKAEVIDASEIEGA